MEVEIDFVGRSVQQGFARIDRGDRRLFRCHFLGGGFGFGFFQTFWHAAFFNLGPLGRGRVQVNLQLVVRTHSDTIVGVLIQDNFHAKEIHFLEITSADLVHHPLVHSE